LGLSPDQMQKHLNKDSGLLGLTECYADRRDVHEHEESNDACRPALEVEAHNVKKYIGAYAAVLNGVDLIIFTGGIGENNITVRQAICNGLSYLGIEFDEKANQVRGEDKIISTKDSRTLLMTVTTDEELVIATDTLKLVK
ncbi:MAG: acetate kinase, partial [Odoribacter sp.]|nr:acetate kinase [Odoribacter sp.]